MNAISTTDHLGFGHRRFRTFIGKSGVHAGELDARLARVPINHGGIFEVLGQDKVGVKERFVELAEGVRPMPPRPFRSRQGLTRIGQPRRPIQRQPCLLGLALQHGVHRPFARPCRNTARRNVGVSLEWQLNEIEPMADKDRVSVLRDVAERTDEVIPMQDCSSVLYFVGESQSCVTGGAKCAKERHPPGDLAICARRFFAN